MLDKNIFKLIPKLKGNYYVKHVNNILNGEFDNNSNLL